ncbi:acyltransferase [Labrenzia sp. DG1229]|uniref:acyltransferase family protein n=1 Tax=Labrenzia sp. DG1229 TaxID=681847 RepID=UPI000691077B|nr:acyltransferase [Labrenzia sp. DG1229]
MAAVTKLENIQALRAIAALGVVLSHAHSRVERTYPSLISESFVDRFGGLSWIGHAGVDLFFVISGFIMIYVHFDDFATRNAPFQFFVKRLIRIVPIYWLLSATALALLFIEPSLFYHARSLDVEWIVSSFLFFPIRSETGVTTPLLGLGWTLNYEMYFYLIFAFCLFFRRSFLLPFMLIFFGASILIGVLISPYKLFVILMTNWLLLEFFLGCLIGYAFRSGFNKLPLPLAVVLIVSAVATILAWVIFGPNHEIRGLPRFLWWGLPAASIVAALVLCPRLVDLKVPKWLLELGNASYSIYLTHIFTLPALALIQTRVDHIALLHPDAAIAVMIIVSAIAGYVFYRVVEKPITRLLTKRYRPMASARQKSATG